MKLSWYTMVLGALALGCAEAPADQAGVPARASAAPVAIPDSAGAVATTGGARAVSSVAAATPAADTMSHATKARRAPAQIRGIYVNAYAAGSSRRLPALLALADTTELNAFVVDVKDENGIHYRSRLALPTSLAQAGEQTIRDLEAFVDTLHAHDVHAIARIVVFKDPVLSKARPDWSIRTPAGELWQDKAGNTWVSAWEPAVWEYNLAIAEEAAAAGFDEIQFDYVRFPEPYPSLPEQVHPKAAGTRTEAIVAFLKRARERLHPHGAIVAADVFGLSPNDGRDINIGQQWEDLLAATDHILPMVYPSHYLPTHLPGVKQPNRMPYETVFNSVGIGMVRVERLRELGIETARVVPWLQAFDAPWVDPDFEYGPEQAGAQIRALYDVGVEDWIFWHPGSRYEHLSAAFAKETGPRAKPFTPSADMRAHVDMVDRAGAAAARARVHAAHAPSAGTATSVSY